MRKPRRRPVMLSALGVLGSAVLLLNGLSPAAAYSSPAEVPNPFQDYSAQDYADALWNLETSVGVRALERESHSECDTQTYTVSHPLDQEPVRTYAHVLSPDGTWCAGEEGDELRAELDAKDEDSEEFFHGRPYENTAQRVPYYGSWADVNGNGVTSRTEIHARDLGNTSFAVTGTYWDHYTGQRVNIGRTETHGEHMIPVGHTWPEMQHRSREARVAYYNDPMNLTSTIGSINREKAGHTPTEWMPSNEDAWCGYAMTWTHIAHKHQISLFGSDVDYLRELLWACMEDELGDQDGQDGSPASWGEASPDLDWRSSSPVPHAPAPEEAEEAEGSGPTAAFSTRDYADALWNMEHQLRIRSVEQENFEDCAVQTFSVRQPDSSHVLRYKRVISAEDTSCPEDERDELRAELDEEDEVNPGVFHIESTAGKRRQYFGYWGVNEEGLTTQQEILARDIAEPQWNSSRTGVRAGEFADPYTGEQQQHPQAETVVDHVLPPAHAGLEMQRRDAAARKAYYNDPRNLLLTTRDAQSQKRGDAPRNWMPADESFHCAYAVTWVHTAVTHQISLFNTDVRQLRQSLYTCLEDAEDQQLSDQRRADLDWASLPPY